MTVSTRRYEQRLRAQTAEETRRRILDATYEELRATPAGPAGIDRIAREAGVARSTVYAIFGSRAGLFDALASDVHMRGGFQAVLDAVADPDPRVHLRDGITGGVRTFAAEREVFRALFTMAVRDPEALAGAMGRLERSRMNGMRRLARRLDEAALLRPGITAGEAADQLWLLRASTRSTCSTAGRGLSPDEIARVFVDMAERSLLADP